MNRGFLFPIAAILLISCSPASGREKSLNISVSASPLVLHEGELVKLKIQIQAGGLRDLPDPALPDQIPGFQVIGRSTRQQFSSTQKGSEIQSIMVLTMVAISPGIYTIPSIKIRARDLTKQSEPIRIKVLKGKGKHPGGQNRENGTGEGNASPDDSSPFGPDAPENEEPQLKDLKTI